MAKKAFSITAKNIYFASQYLRRKLALNGYYPTADTNYDAEKSFRKAHSKVEAINSWTDKYLSKKQKEQLKGAIRQSRRRKKNPAVKTVSISFTAWLYIQEIAERDKVTISAVLEKHLRKEYLKAARIE